MVGIANSSYFSFASQITSVKEAIVRALGLKIARNLALALSLSQPLNQNHCPGFSPGTYWLGALLTAHASRQLSPAVSKVAEPLAPDTAYLCGLLRNLGLLPMVFLFPTEMEQIFAKVKPAADSALIEEQIHLIGVYHRTAGAWLMKQWHLSQVIVDASSFDPESTYAGLSIAKQESGNMIV